MQWSALVIFWKL